MKIIIIALVVFSSSLFANEMVRGMNLTEIGDFKYDANRLGENKTDAQVAVDQIYKLGARHIVLNPTAKMVDPEGNKIIPNTKPQDRSRERIRYKRLISYIKAKGMSVGIRPIFFVVKSDGTFPYIEHRAGGTTKVRWHGNIQPSDPNRWFASFKAYLDSYILIAKLNKVEEFTIGAELYSMTVGIEDQWREHPFGFPKKWLELLRYVRLKLGTNVRIMYDINFTDDAVSVLGNLKSMGGELERWRYRLVDLASPTDPEEFETWSDLVSFWKELDAIGIDMYRSLASETDVIPLGFDSLTSFLQIRADEYALQLDTALAEIEFVTEKESIMIFKELGFRSIQNGFINPFEFETQTGVSNEIHQAASYEALRRAFWDPGFSWFFGASFWDVSVNPQRNSGANDTGFSPIGKPMTTKVLQRLFEVVNPVSN